MTKTKTQHITPVGKFLRMLDYMERVGLDIERLADTAGLNIQELQRTDNKAGLPSYQYSALYEAAAREMQAMDLTLPWGGGIGTDAFRFMCYSLISCQTLRQALERAEAYQRMLFPLTGYRIELDDTGDSARLGYLVDSDTTSKQFLPESWDRTVYGDTVAIASGLKIWHAFIGWLVGRDIELDAVSVAAPYVNDAYADSLAQVFQKPVDFDAEHSGLYFDRRQLDFRLVHTPESLEAFLDNALYTLIVQEGRPSSTSAAVKSLLAKAGAGALPSFESMAEDMHMSVSSLRRRLQQEGTSYQEIKDDYRCDIAIRHLREDQLKVHEIGELLGFLEPSSFIRSFRNWTGLTPKQFRSQR